jgi:hypothetical protein
MRPNGQIVKSSDRQIPSSSSRSERVARSSRPSVVQRRSAEPPRASSRAGVGAIQLARSSNRQIVKFPSPLPSAAQPPRLTRKPSTPPNGQIVKSLDRQIPSSSSRSERAARSSGPSVVQRRSAEPPRARSRAGRRRHPTGQIVQSSDRQTPLPSSLSGSATPTHAQAVDAPNWPDRQIVQSSNSPPLSHQRLSHPDSRASRRRPQMARSSNRPIVKFPVPPG